MVRLFIVFLILLLSGYAIAQDSKVKEHYENLKEEAEGKPHTISFFPDPDLRQIILIRHGEPALKKKGWRSRKKAKQFIIDYDSSGVYTPLPHIPVKLNEGDISVVHTSSMRRSRHTAQLIFGEQMEYRPDTLFREFERKILWFPGIPLPTKFWTGGSRVLWFLGLNDRNIENQKKARIRARLAAEKLVDLANKESRVVLVAHGLLNKSVKKNLKKMGWRVVRKGGSKYLATWVLVRGSYEL